MNDEDDPLNRGACFHICRALSYCCLFICLTYCKIHGGW